MLLLLETTLQKFRHTSSTNYESPTSVFCIFLFWKPAKSVIFGITHDKILAISSQGGVESLCANIFPLQCCFMMPDETETIPLRPRATIWHWNVIKHDFTLLEHNKEIHRIVVLPVQKILLYWKFWTLSFKACSMVSNLT